MRRLGRRVRSVQAALKPQLIRQLKAEKAKLLHKYHNLLANPLSADIVVNSRDTTKRKAAEAALNQANESLEIRVEERTTALTQTNKQLRQEIIEGKKALDALRESEEWFRCLSSYSPVGIFLANMEGCCIYTNLRCQAICGFTLEESLQEGWLQFVHPSDRDRVFADWLTHTRERREYSDEFRFQTKEGIVRWVRVQSSPMFSDRGEFIGHVGILEDISESLRHATLRQQAEEQLTQQRSQQKAILDNIPHLAWLKDKESRFIAVNEAFGKACGLEPEDLIGKTDLDIWHPDLAERYREDDREVMKIGKRKRVEEPAVYQEGKMLWTETIKTPIFNNTGEVIGTTGIAVDITERKQSEEALHRREQEFKALADNSPDIISRFGKQLQHLYVNSAVERAIGISPQIFIGKTHPELGIQPEIYIPFQQILQDVFTTGQPHVFESKSSVSGKCYQARIVPEFALDGSVESVLSVARDITEQKQTEEALRDALQRLNFHFENSPLAVIEWDCNFRVSRWSSEAEKIFGWKAEEVIGKHPAEWQFVFSEDVPTVDSVIQRLIDSSEQRNVSRNRNYTKDGSVVYCEWYNSALLDKSGNLVSVLSLTLDVTKRKQMEEALRESETRFRIMADNVPALIWMSDLNYKGTFFNKAWLDFTGRSLEQELGNGWLESVHPDDLRRCLDTYKSAFNTRQPVRVEYRLKRADGNYRWVLDTGIPRFTPDDSFAGYIGSCIDITERKQAEEEILNALAKEKELSELKSRFVSMTSHEFRTPLSIILSSSELLEYYGDRWTQEERLEQLHLIQSSVNHMTHLLNDVLTLGRADAARLNFNPAPLDLIEFCRTIIAEIQLTASRGHKIIFTSRYQFLSVGMDRMLLRQILNNLLSNAINYSPNNSNIYFEVTSQDGEAILEIQDEGIGIPLADRSRLFEPFHRGTNVSNINGTGLGLAIVKRCVDLHQGRIVLASKIGIGTTFKVVLPLNNRLTSQTCEKDSGD
ncbi:PAS domain S-box protein [Trichocoleus sp. DQ-A1]|nr:PAS domain S-box protein [Coleofasciculus sp. FACHB-129]